MSSEIEAHESGQTEHAEEHAQHEGSLLAHPHPTVLNAYPIVLEAFAGRFEPQTAIRDRFHQAAQRTSHGEFSPAPQAVLQWVNVNTIASWIMMLVLLVVVRLATRRMRRVPSRLQCIWEWTYETLRNFTISMSRYAVARKPRA